MRLRRRKNPKVDPHGYGGDPFLALIGLIGCGFVLVLCLIVAVYSGSGPTR